ncbi:MAG TPA: NADH-ubiquinone oxidoreductase-F iron-sulfur binding region domain-containing protein [Acidimicrobiales bacterium]|nr:NADH-ubiquinone oxidoreductase-F iron-sulfur binding region domain-containing protein [Acidimicrobiales bacterium]
MTTDVAPAPAPPGGAARLLAAPGDAGLRAHHAAFGLLPAHVDLIAAAERAGLRGRGGAAFPTSVKLAAVARRRRAIVVANGTEGEPLSAKDKTLMVTAPHLVLDGVVLAARAVGARDAVVCVERAAGRVVATLERALSERGDDISITVAATPSRYVTGEESALVHWLNGGDAKPTTVPPRPFERGVGGRPTLVQNVETLAHLALIARFGPSWYRSIGTAEDPGTALVTVGGGVGRPGVYEVEQGSGLAATLRAAGLPDGPVPPVLVGGYFGTWLPPSAVSSAALGATALHATGASFGSGVLWALPADACGLAETARVAHWFADQSAGQCGPCVNGLPAIADTLDALVAGRSTRAVLEHLGRYAALVTGRGACHHPDGAARLVTSAVQVFGDEIERHASRGPCPASAHAALPTPRGGGWR